MTGAWTSARGNMAVCCESMWLFYLRASRSAMGSRNVLGEIPTSRSLLLFEGLYGYLRVVSTLSFFSTRHSTYIRMEWV